MDQYQNFLYLIGSVFAPLYAVLLISALTKPWQTNLASLPRTLIACLAWAGGLALYYILLPLGTPVGVSIPTMAAVAVLYFLLILGARLWKRPVSPAI